MIRVLLSGLLVFCSVVGHANALCQLGLCAEKKGREVTMLLEIPEELDSDTRRKTLDQIRERIERVALTPPVVRRQNNQLQAVFRTDLSMDISKLFLNKAYIEFRWEADATSSHEAFFFGN